MPGGVVNERDGAEREARPVEMPGGGESIRRASSGESPTRLGTVGLPLPPYQSKTPPWSSNPSTARPASGAANGTTTVPNTRSSAHSTPGWSTPTVAVRVTETLVAVSTTAGVTPSRPQPPIPASAYATVRLRPAGPTASSRPLIGSCAVVAPCAPLERPATASRPTVANAGPRRRSLTLAKIARPTAEPAARIPTRHAPAPTPGLPKPSGGYSAVRSGAFARGETALRRRSGQDEPVADLRQRRRRLSA